MRRWFNFNDLNSANINDFRLEIFYDEDCEVYINGVLAASLKGFTNHYTFVEISEKAKSSIKIGQPNLVAVKCRNTEGNQFIDLGFVLTNIPIK